MENMVPHSRLGAGLFAALLAGLATSVAAADRPIDLHAVMMSKLDGSCRLDRQRLARFEPRMVVVHAVIDQTSLPGGFARARVLRPVLGGTDAGELLPMANFRPSIGGGRGAHLVEGKEYLISMYRSGNLYVVDRALECQGGA